jgi:hypothetical protein
MCAFFLPFHWLLIGIEELTAIDLATWLVSSNFRDLRRDCLACLVPNQNFRPWFGINVLVGDRI